MIKVQRIINKPVTSNCYVLYDREIGDDCIIIDPGSREEDEVFVFLKREKLGPKYIILTHEHFDHCWGVNALVERYGIPIICSEVCAEAIRYGKSNCSVFYDNKEAFTVNGDVITVEALGWRLAFGGIELFFSKMPGHTEASVSFVIGSYLFTGDTLIKDERTVTKLPTGSKERLKESIELFEKMKGCGYEICPGHGEPFMLDGYDLQKMINAS